MYGSEERIIPSIPLRAGNLTLFYAQGFIRYIKLGENEVLRMINHMVRDHNWNTIPQRIYDEQIDQKENSFRIFYRCEVALAPVHFYWECEIIGSEESNITFRISGKALSSFKRNRIGFTVLHPIQGCTGQDVEIQHTDGKIEKCSFPLLISPHQPFLDICSMQWEVAGCKARLEFSGDVFETEDQRNWTDDSYKTYCTPLSIPFPHQLELGETVSQSIELTLAGNLGKIKQTFHSKHSFTIDAKSVRLPKIGIGRSSEVDQLNANEIAALKNIAFDHYQSDLKLYQKGWKADLENTVVEARELALGLELSVFFDDIDNELKSFVAMMSGIDCHVAMVNLFDRNSSTSSDILLNKSVLILKDMLPDCRIGAGTNAFFTELNRERVEHSEIDYLVYSINPQVHAFDNLSLVETLNAQPYTVQTAKSFSNNKPVHISPVTLKMRGNPNSTEEEEFITEELPGNVDPRQMSLFGAGWVLGCLQNLLNSGVEAITFFETVGLKGLMQSKEPGYAHRFHAPQGSIYPMYYIFRYLLKHKDREFFAIKASDPFQFGGIVVGEAKAHLVLSNFSAETLSIQVPIEFQNCQGIVLDANSMHRQLDSPEWMDGILPTRFYDEVQLSPFATAFISS